MKYLKVNTRFSAFGEVTKDDAMETLMREL